MSGCYSHAIINLTAQLCAHKWVSPCMTAAELRAWSDAIHECSVYYMPLIVFSTMDDKGKLWKLTKTFPLGQTCCKKKKKNPEQLQQKKHSATCCRKPKQIDEERACCKYRTDAKSKTHKPRKQMQQKKKKNAAVNTTDAQCSRPLGGALIGAAWNNFVFYTLYRFCIKCSVLTFQY